MKPFNTLAGALIASSLYAGAAVAQTELSMWYHGAGSESEMALINGMLDEFNASQSDWKVVIQSFPQIAYNDSVVAGALAGTLPDIIDIDGPILPNWAWAAYIQPLVIDEIHLAREMRQPYPSSCGISFSLRELRRVNNDLICHPIPPSPTFSYSSDILASDYYCRATLGAMVPLQADALSPLATLSKLVSANPARPGPDRPWPHRAWPARRPCPSALARRSCVRPGPDLGGREGGYSSLPPGESG